MRSTVSVLSGDGAGGGAAAPSSVKSALRGRFLLQRGAGGPLSKEVPTGQWDKSSDASSGSVRATAADQAARTLSSDTQARGTREGTCMNLQRKPSADWEEF